MFIFDWFWNVLSSLGLYRKNAKIVFLGLDNAGKTTLLHMLRDDRLAVHIPTQKPTMEELTMGSVKFRAYDLGGHEIARKVWSQYYAEVDAVVFLVDTTDHERFKESKNELDALLKTEELSDVPFVVLGNKIDLPTAVSEDELREYYGLRQTYGKQVSGNKNAKQPIEVFMCSVVRRQGYKEAFQWLSQFL